MSDALSKFCASIQKVMDEIERELKAETDPWEQRAHELEEGKKMLESGR